MFKNLKLLFNAGRDALCKRYKFHEDSECGKMYAGDFFFFLMLFYSCTHTHKHTQTHTFLAFRVYSSEC